MCDIESWIVYGLSFTYINLGKDKQQRKKLPVVNSD